jgi:SAM-dependent methyltransferase
MGYGDVDVTTYGTGFFDALTRESGEAAAIVVPLLLALVPSRSILDVGCGTGAWSAACLANGVPDVTGVDGNYVDRGKLLVPTEVFHPHDLTQPLNLSRRFDLALCLEVAEHLPAESADILLESLARHSDLIVFSSAIPGQGGTNHLNEQWPSYWIGRFSLAGYEVFDVLRPRLWTDGRVGFWFRQNLLLFANAATADRVRGLPDVSAPIDIVHPEQFRRRNEALSQVPPVRTSLRNLRAGVQRKVSRWRRQGPEVARPLTKSSPVEDVRPHSRHS